MLLARRIGLNGLLCLLTLLFSLALAPVHAAETGAALASQSQKTLDGLRQTLQATQARLQKPDGLSDADLVSMRGGLVDVQEEAADIEARLEPELSRLAARATQLGAADEQAAESAELAQERAQLQKLQAELDGQVKLARLISVESAQGIDQISRQRRQIFQAELGQRSTSVLMPRFWQSLQRDLPVDLRRVGKLVQGIHEQALKAPGRMLWLSGIVALVLMLGGAVTGRRLAGFTINHTKPSRLRRSFYAAALIALYTLVPGLLASLASMVLHWGDGLSSEMDGFISQCVVATYLGGFVTGMGRVLLAPHRPTWRLPPLPGEVADKMGWLPWTLGVLVALAWVFQQLLSLANASLSSTLLVNSFNTLALNAIIGFAAWKLAAGLRRSQPAAGDEAAPASASSALPGWVRLIPTMLVGLMVFGLIAFLLGYIALSSLIVQEILWIAIVICACYVLLALTLDLSQTLLMHFKEKQAAGILSQSQVRARSQIAILLAGAVRLALVIVAVTLLLLPFGEDPGEWLQRRLGFLLAGFDVGQIHIRPSSVLVAVLVLLLGVAAVRLVQRWLVNQLLPATRIDAGMRVSTANLVSYVGYFIVGAMTISSLGIGLDRMAWIISALSVGIGFGLQAVVQNFVSGLILLAERPIKVGDWVSLNGVEGNVRKINARATEIEMFDRSTLIVPNSEFITKTVRNVTLTNPLGVVTVKILMPIDSDPKRVRDIMLEAMHEHPDVLSDPEPGVSLDGFDNNGLAFSASCFVASPRISARTRSALMFEVLDRLRRAGLPLHHTQTMSVLPPEDPPRPE